jgi:hypothetical protein
MRDDSNKRRTSPFARMCAACEAPVEITASNCWLCGAKLGPQGTRPANWTEAAPRPAAERKTVASTDSLSLASWLIFLTLSCVVIGLFAIAPGLGLPLGVVALIGWVATADTLRLRRHGNHSAKGFIATLALVLVAGVASMIAFLATCIASFAVGISLDRSSPERYGGMAIGAAIGLSAGVSLAGYIYRRLTGQRKPSDSEGDTT